VQILEARTDLQCQTKQESNQDTPLCAYERWRWLTSDPWAMLVTVNCVRSIYKCYENIQSPILLFVPSYNTSSTRLLVQLVHVLDDATEFSQSRIEESTMNFRFIFSIHSLSYVVCLEFVDTCFFILFVLTGKCKFWDILYRKPIPS
jgi:hypothetical protein